MLDLILAVDEKQKVYTTHSGPRNYAIDNIKENWCCYKIPLWSLTLFHEFSQPLGLCHKLHFIMMDLMSWKTWKVNAFYPSDTSFQWMGWTAWKQNRKNSMVSSLSPLFDLSLTSLMTLGKMPNSCGAKFFQKLITGLIIKANTVGCKESLSLILPLLM